MSGDRNRVRDWVTAIPNSNLFVYPAKIQGRVGAKDAGNRRQFQIQMREKAISC
jgi:hypothetical protein